MTFSSFLFLAFVFLLPFNIKIPVYLSGFSSISSDFTSFFVYPQEIILFLSFLFFSHKHSARFSPSLWIILLLILFSLPSFFFAQDPLLSFLSTIRVLEFVIVFYLINHHVVPLSSIVRTLGASLFIQGSIAIMQFIHQAPLGLHAIGESSYSLFGMNVAKIDFLQHTIMRSYGTFPHPNILGGFLAVGIILIFLSRAVMRKIIGRFGYMLLIMVSAGGLFFTFSRSALLGLLLGLALLYVFSKRKNNMILSYAVIILLSILTILFPYSSVRFQGEQVENMDRIVQVQDSFHILSSHPWGIGFANDALFLQQNQAVSPISTIWQDQPVHNAFLLLLNELGVLAGCLLLAIFTVFLVRIALSPARIWLAVIAALLPPLLFDHYLITLFQGIMLFALVAGILNQQIKHTNTFLHDKGKIS